MRVRALLLIVAVSAVSACGNGRNDKAAAACADEIGHRLANRHIQLDPSDMARHVATESADTVLVTSSVVLDSGLSNESRETFDCRVRFDAAGVPSVLYLQLNWNTSDLKQPR